MTRFFLSAIVISLIVLIESREPCILRLNSVDGPFFAPFLLTPEKTLYPVENRGIRISHGSEVIVTCENNYLKEFNKASNITVLCQDDTLIAPDKNAVTFKKLGCDLRIIEEAQHSVDQCKDEYQGIINFYYDTDKQAYIKLAEVCYDYEKNRNVFVRTYVSSAFPASEMVMNVKRLSSNTNIGHRIALLTTYRPDKIANKLFKILGDDYNEHVHALVTVKMLPKTLFNGQLADVEKFPTNNVALWSNVDKGNWMRVFNDVQKFLEDRKETLEFIVGTDGTAHYGNNKIYLGEKDTVPVPKYAWVVLHDKKTHKGIAIMTLNDPFVESSTEPLISGENMCKKVPWLTSLLKNNNFNRPAYGLTFCCELSRFKAFSVENKSWYTKDSILLA